MDPDQVYKLLLDSARRKLAESDGHAQLNASACGWSVVLRVARQLEADGHWIVPTADGVRIQRADYGDRAVRAPTPYEFRERMQWREVWRMREAEYTTKRDLASELWTASALGRRSVGVAVRFVEGEAAQAVADQVVAWARGLGYYAQAVDGTVRVSIEPFAEPEPEPEAEPEPEPVASESDW